MRYRVYCDTVLIADTFIPDPSMHLIDPQLEIEDSSAGSFSFSITEDNPGYSLISPMTSTIMVKQDSTVIWTGRVRTVSENFWKQRQMSCEGALAFLNDTITPISTYKNLTVGGFFRQMISRHNSLTSYRAFMVGTITVQDTSVYDYVTENETTWEAIKKNLIDRLGGHIIIRYQGSSRIPIIDYYDEYPNLSSQEINFGENLLDFAQNWDLSNLTTVVLPRGKQKENDDANGQRQYITVESVNNNSPYVSNSESVARYGNLYKTLDFNDVESPSTLLKLSQIYLRSEQFEEMTIEISAIDLHNFNSDIVKLNLADKVRVVSPPHGMDKIFPITKISIPLENPGGVKYTIGITAPSYMSSGTNNSLSGLAAKIRNLPKFSGLLEMAKLEASEILNQRTTGYVTIVQENETSQALIVSDNENWLQASKMWKFDMNGLGYSDKTYGQIGYGTPDQANERYYSTAITMDGTIVADFIKTGILSDGGGQNGTSLNSWNLQTGEFKLSPTTQLKSSDGSDPEYLSTISKWANQAFHKTSGGANLLDGTATFKNWYIGGRWSIITDNANGFSFARCAAGSARDNDVICSPSASLPLSSVNEKDLVISYGVRGIGLQTGNLIGMVYIVDTQGFVLGKSIKFECTFTEYTKAYEGPGFNGGGQTFERAQLESLVYEQYKNTNPKYVILSFRNYSNKQIDLAHISMREGLVSIPWSPSEKDRMIFTTDQVAALDRSLTQVEILNRLTNKGKNTGIYLQDRNLYINASAIQAGIINAKFIKTGAIVDNRGLSSWNLDRGNFTTGLITLRKKEAFRMGGKIIDYPYALYGIGDISAHIAGVSMGANLGNAVSASFGSNGLAYDSLVGPGLWIFNKNNIFKADSPETVQQLVNDHKTAKQRGTKNLRVWLTANGLGTNNDYIIFAMKPWKITTRYAKKYSSGNKFIHNGSGTVIPYEVITIGKKKYKIVNGFVCKA